MSQSSSDKYVYFTVGILKDTPTLEALRQDAIKHHMVDHPGQLIALRLAEHYEMLQNVSIQAVMSVTPNGEAAAPGEKEKPTETTAPHPARPGQPHAVHLASASAAPAHPGQRSLTPLPPTVNHGGAAHGQQPGRSTHNNPLTGQITGRMRALRMESDNVISTSPNADQNADDAADYWNAL